MENATCINTKNIVYGANYLQSVFWISTKILCLKIFYLNFGQNIGFKKKIRRSPVLAF